MNLIRVIPAKGSGVLQGLLKNPSIFPPLARKDRRLFLWCTGGLMHLVINGSEEQSDSATLADLIDRKGLRRDSLVVELNGAIVRQQQWAATTLQDGDRVELLNFVGGG